MGNKKQASSTEQTTDQSLNLSELQTTEQTTERPADQTAGQSIDFSIPRRMSKSAFVVFFYNELKRYISLILLILVLNLDSFQDEGSFSLWKMTSRFMLILVGVLAISSLTAFLSYYFKKFYVKDGNLVFMQGVLRRKTTSIPVYKIHSTRTKRGLVYRLLDMKSVSFDTLASKTEEIELILDDADWDALLIMVESQESKVSRRDERDERDANTDATPTSDSETAQSGYRSEMERDAVRAKTAETALRTADLYRDETVNINDCNHFQSHVHSETNVDAMHFSNLNLIKGAFCQNHLKGMAILGSAFLALYGKISEVSDEAVVYAVDYLAENVTQESLTVTVFLSLIIIFYFIVMLLWIGKIFLRYFNMEVRTNQSQLFFESGLFTRMSSQFSYDKVCTVYIKQNILEKCFGCCTLNLKQAFNATDQKDESDVKIYGSNKAGHFLHWWLGKDFTSSEEIISAHSGNGLYGYTVKFDVLLTFAITIVLSHFDLYPWIIFPAFYLIYSLVKGFFAVRNSYITLKNDYLVIHNGQLACIRNYVKYANIEVVRLVRTPFTPYFHRVNLVLSTNGTSFVVRSLKEEEAKEIYELLICYCRN